MNEIGYPLREGKPSPLRRGEKKRKGEEVLTLFEGFPAGFTILEVMVALAIMGISLGIFFGLIGNSSRLRGKLDEHTKLLLLARNKTEEAFLGILGKKHTRVHEKKTFDGVTKDGIHWEVSAVNKYQEAMEKIALNIADIAEDSLAEVPPKGTTLLSSHVGGISIETIFFAEESGGEHEEEYGGEEEIELGED